MAATSPERTWVAARWLARNQAEGAAQSMAVDRRTGRSAAALYGYWVILLRSYARGWKSAWPPDGHALRLRLVPHELRIATDVHEGLYAAAS